jgi:Putative auto-transporter adhesin, head GIN domain
MAHGQDGGPTVSKSYSVGNFDQIEVGGPFDVEVRTGANPGVTARGPQHILEHLIVEVRGGKLVIRPEHQNGLFRSGWHFNGDVDVSVTVPMLRSAALGGSGDLKVNEVRGDSFEGSIGGSGGLEVGRVDVQSLKLAVSGSGGAKAAGRANTAAFDIAGSGDIDAKGVQSQTADVSVAGSGSVAANATHTASVSIIGSGDVEVTGGAKCSVTKTGSGDATCS